MVWAFTTTSADEIIPAESNAAETLMRKRWQRRSRWLAFWIIWMFHVLPCLGVGKAWMRWLVTIWGKREVIGYNMGKAWGDWLQSFENQSNSSDPMTTNFHTHGVKCRLFVFERRLFFIPLSWLATIFWESIKLFTSSNRNCTPTGWSVGCSFLNARRFFTSWRVPGCVAAAWSCSTQGWRSKRETPPSGC